MKEIQGKSILVRVSSRFDLARVRVIGRQLYLEGHGLFRTFLDISPKKRLNLGFCGGFITFMSSHVCFFFET